MDAQMKKGIIEMCVLHLISTKEKYYDCCLCAWY